MAVLDGTEMQLLCLVQDVKPPNLTMLSPDRARVAWEPCQSGLSVGTIDWADGGISHLADCTSFFVTLMRVRQLAGGWHL